MAMEENEKMEALTKAYAEIILNTSKEAAVRVMASERKAQQFEHDLRLAKEEASRMLLRLKQMLDAKTAAVDIIYSNQQNKIDELEAQLNEAEGVIVDLRVELKQAEEKLDKVKKQNVQPSNRQFEIGYTGCSDGVLFENNLTNPEPFITSNEIGTRLLTSDIKMSSSDVSIINQETCMSQKQTVISYMEPEKYFMSDQALSSLTSMKPDLYRNGCTQRIRATERTVDEKGLPEDGPPVPTESEATIISNELGKISAESARFNPTENVSGSEPVFARGTKDVPLTVCKNQKREILFGKSKLSSCSLRRCRSMRSQRPTLAISPRKFFPHTRKTENSSEMVQTVQPDKDQAVSVVRRSLRKRKVRQWDDFTACGRQGSPPDKSIESSRQRNSELIDESVAVKQELTNGALRRIFSRKCKEESLVNPDGHSAVGKSSRKRRFGEKQNNASGPLGSNMRTASPDHSRGLLQIARQLVSLSGRDSQ